LISGIVQVVGFRYFAQMSRGAFLFRFCAAISAMAALRLCHRIAEQLTRLRTLIERGRAGRYGPACCRESADLIRSSPGIRITYDQ